MPPTLLSVSGAFCGDPGEFTAAEPFAVTATVAAPVLLEPEFVVADPAGFSTFATGVPAEPVLADDFEPAGFAAVAVVLVAVEDAEEDVCAVEFAVEED
jgi:hypothetical protein